MVVNSISYVYAKNYKPKCCPLLSRIPYEITTSYHRDKETMGRQDPLAPKDMDRRIGRKETNRIAITNLNADAMLKWRMDFIENKKDFSDKSKKYVADEGAAYSDDENDDSDSIDSLPIREAWYTSCNVGLMLNRMFCVSRDDSIEQDKEIQYIFDSGVANCSIFAYALLRKGGMKPPDGVPRRHIIFSSLSGILALIQIHYGPPGYDPNTSEEVASKVRRWIIFIFPAVTLLSGIIATVRNCIRGTVSVRTPEAVFNLVKLHNKNKSAHFFRRVLGPNNCLTWTLYVLLVVAAIDTTEVVLSTDLTSLDNASFIFGAIEIILFFGSMVLDYKLQSKTAH